MLLSQAIRLLGESGLSALVWAAEGVTMIEEKE